MRYFLFILIFCAGCNIIPDNKSSSDFYKNISNWDIQYIPVIDPVRVSTMDRGTTWRISGVSAFSSEIESFGVSGNFIYGRQKACDSCSGNWFLFDIYTKMQKYYDSEKEIRKALGCLNCPFKEIQTCSQYFTELTEDKPCYWYPSKGQVYKIDSLQYAYLMDTLTVSLVKGSPKMAIPKLARNHCSGFGFYRVILSDKLPDSLFLSYEPLRNNEPNYRQLKQRMLLPLIFDSKEIELTLYVPYDAARRQSLVENILDHATIKRVDK